MKLEDLAKVQARIGVNLGAGTRPVSFPGYRNQDKYPGDAIDDVFDLDGPWPYADGTIQDLASFHALEHLNDPIHFMREAGRVLKPGGHLLLRLPYGRNDVWGMDFTHVKPMFTNSFMEYLPGTLKWTYNLQHTEGWPDVFWIDEVRRYVSVGFTKRPFWKWLLKHYGEHLWNVYDEMLVYMHRLSAEEIADWRPEMVKHIQVKTVVRDGTETVPVCTWDKLKEAR